ncbi:DUF7848 domain-containing protein [Streptomyces sp. H27-D2]|uniref:DUF7848 domain-containing protein n=1 Tax=Streptomyces sp. H27-D2 TaxID=3046304 RepID=UPI003FA6E10B
MAARSVWRFVDWTLSVGTSGSGPIYVTECATCGTSSDAADDTEGPETWCLQHAGRTGHTGFRSTITSFFRASPADATSLAEPTSDGVPLAVPRQAPPPPPPTKARTR